MCHVGSWSVSGGYRMTRQTHRIQTPPHLLRRTIISSFQPPVSYLEAGMDFPRLGPYFSVSRHSLGVVRLASPLFSALSVMPDHSHITALIPYQELIMCTNSTTAAVTSSGRSPCSHAINKVSSTLDRLIIQPKVSQLSCAIQSTS